jgi:hypothetical protein
MTERNNTAIHIGQLNLRMPGANSEAGQQLANSLAENLAQRIPADARRHIGALSVRVPVAVGASEADMSAAITGAIARALSRPYRTTNTSDPTGE